MRDDKPSQFDRVFDSLTFVTAHEMIEAITDPAIGNAHGAQGWYPEVADPCGGEGFYQPGTDGLNLWVTEFWSHRDNYCRP